MIRIWNIKYQKEVFKNKLFNIRTRIFFFVFPFTNLYIDIRRDGNLFSRDEKKVIFFIGIWNYNITDTIEDNTKYTINIGYVK